MATIPPARRSGRLKRATFVVITAMLVLAASELISLVGLVIFDGGLSFSEIHDDQRRRSQGFEKNAPPPLDEVLHPFLGWVLNADIPDGVEIAETNFPVNRLGFLDQGNSPTAGNPNRVRVAIVGGSVAWYFSMHGRKRLVERLQQDPRYQGQQIDVVSLALSGYKQPQQLMTLAWLLSLGASFDVVVNIDGFNEVTLHPAENHPKQVHVGYPRGWHERVRELPRSEIVHTLYRHSSLRIVRRDWALWFSELRFPCRYSPSLNLAWRWRDNRLRQQLDQDLSVISSQWLNQARVYMHTGPENGYTNDEEMYDELVALWKRSSLQLHRLCQGNRIGYLHVLQPNQYVAGSKPLTAEEREIAIEPKHKYRPGVIHGYPRLVSAGRQLAAEGVDFLDLTMLFSKTRQPIYIDDCCHYNQQGNDMVADSIADRILQTAPNR